MVNLWIVKKYLQHRFKGTSRHGLHSPFVYRLVDQVVYDFSKKADYALVECTDKSRRAGVRRKANRLLYRLVADYKPNNLALLGNVDGLTQQYLVKGCPRAELYISNIPRQLSVAIIATDEARNVIAYFNDCLPHVNEDTMLVFDSIYKNKAMRQAWQQIKDNPAVTVTVDLFWIGLVFFRKGQVREDFWIRF